MPGFNPTPWENLVSRIGPSPKAQLNIPNPSIETNILPQRTSSIAPTSNSKFYDMLKGIGQNVIGDTLYMNDLAGAPFSTLTSMLPESVSQYVPGGSIGGMRSEMERMSTPQNMEQWIGNIGGSLVTPGPDELLIGAKLASKALGTKGLGLAAGSLNDVAKRMGKKFGSITSEFLPGKPGHTSPEILIRDAERTNGWMHDDPTVVGHIEFKDPGDANEAGYLPVFNTNTESKYHDKGLGSEMYHEALKAAQAHGYKGLESDPYMRNPYSNQVWDRPGIVRKGSGKYRSYDLMDEFLHRGREYPGSTLKNLFEQDKTIQPMLPGVKEHVIDQLRFHPEVPYPPKRASPDFMQEDYTPLTYEEEVARLKSFRELGDYNMFHKEIPPLHKLFGHY